MNPKASLLWCFIHMSVHIGSVLDMVVVFLERLQINHCSYVQYLGYLAWLVYGLLVVDCVDVGI